MSSQENKELVQRYLQALSGKPKPPELVNQFVDEQPLRDHISTYEQAFPEYVMEIEKMVAEDDLVSVIAMARGTQQGPLAGIPLTGKSFDVPVHITYKVQGGKIVDHWLVMDTALFMQQMGLIPTPESGQTEA